MNLSLFVSITYGLFLLFFTTTVSYGQNKNIVLMEGFSAGTIDNKFQYTQSGLHFITNNKLKNKIYIESDIFVLDQGFAQALIGSKYFITEHLQVSALVGLVNTPSNPLRLGSTLVYQTLKWEGLFAYQWGPKSSYFYVYEWARKIKKVVIGIRGQRFLSTGFFLGGQLWKGARIWTQTGYDFEFKNYSAALGLSVFFF